MKCLKCGAENDPDVSWCIKCLTEIPSNQPRYLLCPECRHKNDPTAFHCEVCHEGLRPGQAE
ncbi:MAG: zinc ribbon domain-containing protein [Nitrospirae bacterium]|nr:zinc ribbon domain-containing protein [Candidatus Troglogloeales bacterium]